MRKVIAVVAGIAILVAVNWTIYAREQLLESGKVVRLELAPVDPRSLMQGDYMALRFKAANDAFGRGIAKDSEDGRIVVRIDGRQVGQFVRRDDGSPLADGEVAMRYRVRAGNVKFATNAFFFQEGTAQSYAGARYGEFRVAPSGDMLLTSLLGKDLELLGRAAR